MNFQIRCRALPGKICRPIIRRPAATGSTVRFLCWLGFIGLLGTCVAGAQPLKLRVHNPDTARALAAKSARVIADYDSFQLLEINTNVLPLEAADARGAEPAPEMDQVRLNARIINTRSPEAQAARVLAPPDAGQQLRLIQFAGPVKPEWFEELRQTGVRVVSYIPHNAYLVYGNPGATARMRAWSRSTPHVQWDGEYGPDDKIHPRARWDAGQSAVPPEPDADLFGIQMIEDANANAETLALIDRLQLEPAKNQFRTLHYLNVVVRLPPSQLSLIAARPDVISIQRQYKKERLDERQCQILAGEVTGNSPSSPGYLAWLAGRGFSQAQFNSSGFVVDITDSGIDNGTTAPGHFGLYQAGDPGQSSRVVYTRLEGTGNPGSTVQGCDGHGTLNAHILAGYNDLAAGFPHTDSAGYHYALGVCPFVQVGSSVIFDPDMFTYPDYADLQSNAYRDGARISGNSWGATAGGAYDIDAQAYDFLVRDAQPAGSTNPAAGNQEMIIVFAAGNKGPGLQTIASPASAKNVITVGSSENVRPASTAHGGADAAGTDGCTVTDVEANSLNDISGFSSRGSCSDGRMKPDLVAPGAHVTGGVGQPGPPTTSGTGTALSCYNASGICALPNGGSIGNPNNFFPLSQEFYSISSGTSHSTPAAAGACALLRQFFINNSLPPPSPALTKAWLMNSCRYLTGTSANDDLWSATQGMGLLDMGAAFNDAQRLLRDQMAEDKFTATGQSRVFTGTVTDPTRPFRVTLAWTDAPGNPASLDAFNNDLDLAVTIGGTTYKGNVFSGPHSAPGGAYDFKNNVESVFLPAGALGAFTITVTAANINSDGVPNESPAVDQDFALIVNNATDELVPVVTIDSTAIIAESCVPANGAIDPDESVTVTFTLNNIGSANTTNLIATLLATNGVVPLSDPQPFGALIAGGAAVTRSFSFSATGTCGDLILPTLQLQDGATVFRDVERSFTLGSGLIVSNTFTNSANISIPSSGKASPYPSTIAVSGLTGVVSSVRLTLAGLRHTFPDDLDVLLKGPGGTNALLMSDCGGGNDLGWVNLVFDDGAGTGLPDSGQIVSGAWRCTNYDTATDSFPSPAPAAPFGQNLAVFRGSAPNGTWSLFVRDDQTQDSGSITQGWRLEITTSNIVCCSGPQSSADLALGQSVIPPITNSGGLATFTIAVTNLGPDNADAVTVADSLPAGFVFVSAGSTQGSCTNDSGTITCALGTLNSGSSALITIEAAAATPGAWTNTAALSCPLFDPVLTNNAASVAAAVNAAPEISPLPDVQTNVNAAIGPLAFTVSDAETPASALVVFAASSNTNVVASDHVVLGGSGANRTVTITPQSNQIGSATITLAVTDGMAWASNSFLATFWSSNRAPVLAAIPDRTVHAGWLLVVTNSATDPDNDPLLFSLGTNAPAGAEVDGAGVFRWTPGAGQVNTTNTIDVIVTDTGIPALSDSDAFVVTVVAPPLIQSISVSNSTVTLLWSAISGQTYRVQYSATLGNGNWTNLVPDVTASGATASRTDTLGPTLRFYRVLVP